MRKRRGETKVQRAARKAHEDYPKSRADTTERQRFDAARYVRGSKVRRGVSLDNR